jgi:hypothetical protein
MGIKGKAHGQKGAVRGYALAANPCFFLPLRKAVVSGKWPDVFP